MGNTFNKSKTSQLFKAIQKNNLKLIATLIKSGADLDMPAKGPGTIPLMACGFIIANIKKLAALGADLNATSGSRKETSLHYALRWCNTDSCEALIALGADPTIKNKKGDSAIDVAYQDGHDDLYAAFIRASKAKAPKQVGKKKPVTKARRDKNHLRNVHC